MIAVGSVGKAVGSLVKHVDCDREGIVSSSPL